MVVTTWEGKRLSPGDSRPRMLLNILPAQHSCGHPLPPGAGTAANVGGAVAEGPVLG